ncbi:hypothetical protein G3I55_23220 [Streptomyces sp. SID6648]|nr:hypothetical protein [Streptomyces sp. SID6648]
MSAGTAHRVGQLADRLAHLFVGRVREEGNLYQVTVPNTGVPGCNG